MQQFQNGLQYKPGGKVLVYFIVSRLVPIVVVLFILGIALSFLQSLVLASPSLIHLLPFHASQITKTGLPALIVFGIVAILFIVIGAWIEYASVKFMFDDFAFHIEHGLISKSEIAIPFRQIQNVSHQQTLGEKMWGIVRVIVETAGTDDMRNARSGGVLPVLDADLAFALEQELLRRSSGK
jgi:putative membrane protein